MTYFKKIKEYVVESSPAVVLGHVYRLPSGFPAFLRVHNELIEGAPDRIEGELLKLCAPDLVYTLLDEFHGVSALVPEKSLHFKEKIFVQINNGDFCEANIYVMNRAKLPKTAACIFGGRWREDLNTNPALAQTLTARQLDYIRRLSTASGRDIIPIDLELYRELIGLELIIDKGRRLALSRLGKEVVKGLA
ncbi:MAG: hypothetical protein A2Z20_04335 [Bdellovibrionales bacterium RBG_16_40_8]|nr:MAG: hypothetical protein A2Z20_04335 [Bdellovibrionales bacterium RBG_16_40_8]